MSDSELELFRQHRAGQDKYTYFLLAAAASGIAFAVRSTTGAILHWSLIPIGMAVFCWGLSFFHGCRYLQYIGSNLYANFHLLKVHRGQGPSGPLVLWQAQAAAEGIGEAMKENQEIAGRHYDKQFRYLISGAVLFVAWHVLGIVLRSGVPAGQP